MNPPLLRILVYALLGGIVFVIIVPVIIILVLLVLSLIGFGKLGPVAGSFAARWQSGLGNVVAGSRFAILQSIRMTRVRPVRWCIIFGVVGVAIGALIGWLKTESQSIEMTAVISALWYIVIKLWYIVISLWYIVSIIRHIVWYIVSAIWHIVTGVIGVVISAFIDWLMGTWSLPVLTLQMST